MNHSYSAGTPQLSAALSEENTQTGLMAFAFVAGVSIDLASIFIGNPYIVTAIAGGVALLLALIWMEDELPWMLFVSIIAANPVNLQMPIAANLMFALWLLFLHMDYLGTLPRWLFAPLCICLAGVLTSAVTWVFFPTTLNPLNQLASIVNYVLGPFLLLPIIYFRARGSRFSYSSVLVLFFVVPSLISILLAYIFGRPLAGGITSSDIQTNLFTYVYGKTEFQFIRTHIGFLLASFMCASVATILCVPERWIRLLAGITLSVSFFLLMVTGSIASAISAIAGMILILIMAFRHFSASKYIAFITTMLILFAMIWMLSPKVVQDYVITHYEQRFGGDKVNNADRDERWGPSARYILKNPGGVGWSLYVEEIKIYPHNDYLAYGIGYGILGGIAYAYVLLRLLWLMLNTVKDVRTHSQLTMALTGIGVLAVIIINSFSDHMSANRWYFNIVWALVWFSYFASQPDEEAERGA